MIKVLFVLISFFLISCAQNPIKVIKKSPKPKFEMLNIEAYKGKVKYVELGVQNLADGVYEISCSEESEDNPFQQKLPVQVEKSKVQFYYAESYFSKAKKHNCFFQENLILRISVKDFPYKSEKLNVAKGKVTLSSKDQARVAREREITKKLYANSARESYIKAPFVKPLNSYITSHYGKRRLFNNKKRSQHLGNDFRARVGVKIPSSNRGKVVYVGNLFYTGNVVIVDHGLNLFSLYAHLSKPLVKIGDMVEAGQIVGLSGATGRVSGPHLHWGIKLNGHNVDGFSLIEESKIQFNL